MPHDEADRRQAVVKHQQPLLPTEALFQVRRMLQEVSESQKVTLQSQPTLRKIQRSSLEFQTLPQRGELQTRGVDGHLKIGPVKLSA